MPIESEANAEFVKLDIQELSTSNPFLAFSDLCDQIKVSNFLIFSLDKKHCTLKDAAVFSNWPPGLLEQCGIFNIHNRTNLPKLISQSAMPFNWRFSTVDKTYLSNFELVLQESSLLDGLVLPVHDATLSGMAAIISGNDLRLSGAQIGTLLLATANVFENYKTLSDINPKSKEFGLSKKELECLSLTALGKTAHEIGIAFDLSEHTINSYIASACNRLGARTRSNAVAMAVKAGIITISN